MTDLVRNVAVLTAPAYEPVSLDTARLYCRVDDDITADNAIIRLLIAAARERAEDITGRAFVERRLELRLDQFPADSQSPIELPYAPLQVVEYIRYTDTGGTQRELSGSPDAFLTDAGSAPGRIAPLYGQSWPSSNGQPGSVRIGYRCGYAPVGSPLDERAYQDALPALLRQWMAARISTWYDNRDHLVTGVSVADLPRDFVDGLLDGLRVHRLFA